MIRDCRFPNSQIDIFLSYDRIAYLQSCRSRRLSERQERAHSGSTGSDEIVHCLSHQVPTFTHYCTTETSKACSVGLFRCRLGGISPRRPRGGFKAPRAVIVTNLIWIPQLGNMFKFIPMTVEKHFDISICFSRCMDGGRHTILYRATTNLQEFYDFWLNWKIGSQ